MNINFKPEIRKNDVVIQQLENELLIYNLKDNKAFCLNRNSAMVWQLCDGTKSISEIAELMSKDLKMSISEDFVWLAISDLRKEGLVEVESNQPFLEGKSRREVIRKIGFASMITLPVISSLVAPRAVDAQSSCLILGQTCTFNNNTQSNCCSGLRCINTVPPRCDNCRTSGVSYLSARPPFVNASQCQNFCNNEPTRNRCCNTTSPVSSANTNGFCNCLCP
jgi:hypothetical protein